MKNGSTTITQRRGDDLPSFNIDSQTEYSWRKTHVMYLGSVWYRVLWVAQTERDHYWGSLPNTIDEIEPSTQGKTRPLLLQHDKIILLHDNARLHVAAPVKTYLETLKWEVLPYPPYSPDIAPSDYHFRSTHGLSEQHIIWRYQKLYRWLDSLKRWSVLPTRYSRATRKKSGKK